MTTITPNDPNIVYSPYTWKVDATVASTISSGAYLRAAIQGAPPDLALLFDLTDVTGGKGTIAYRVDTGAWITATVNTTSIALTLDPSWSVHVVELVLLVRGGTTPIWTAPPNGLTKFAGFSSSATISTREVARKPLYGFALGDSLNMGILAGGNKANDARYGWGFPLAAQLGAEIGVRGFGGVGLTKSGDGGVPEFLSMWDRLWENQAADFTTRAPDFIVTMPGTNDSGATDSAVTAATTALLNAMLAKVSCPIFVVRTLKGIKEAAIRQGIDGCSEPSRVTWIDSTGWWVAADSSDGTHPYGYANMTVISPKIAQAITTGTGNKSSTFWWNGSTWVRQ